MSTAPTVYFIDDSATMREVIKIAFRRENINVVAHHDAASALGEIERARPDVVITDVIMPEKDGYEVCQFIKNHPGLARIPVILMSGVVNRAVAERAFAVKADELLRKPFQPQDLIARVKQLLKPNGQPAPTPAAAASAAAALTSIFSAASAAQQARPPVSQVLGPQPVPNPAPRIVPPAPSAPAAAVPAPGLLPVPHSVPVAPAPAATTAAGPVSVSTSASTAPAPAPTAGPIAVAATSASASATGKTTPVGDLGKLKLEILRLEGLVKKLQSELSAEREYSRALEEHVKTLQEND
jgi:CheY-like chemotaxis protein